MLKVEVVSALPLTPAEEGSATQKAKAVFGEKLEVDFIVKPEIIGGLIFKSPTKILDLSVTEKINRLKTYLEL